MRWRAESIVNEHLASDVLQLRNLVDALTAVSDIYCSFELSEVGVKSNSNSYIIIVLSYWTVVVRIHLFHLMKWDVVSCAYVFVSNSLWYVSAKYRQNIYMTKISQK